MVLNLLSTMIMDILYAEQFVQVCILRSMKLLEVHLSVLDEIAPMVLVVSKFDGYLKGGLGSYLLHIKS